MSQVGNIFNIPNFLKARSAQALRALMLENNAKRNMEFNYYQVVFADGFWFAWYYDLAKEYLTLTKKVK